MKFDLHAPAMNLDCTNDPIKETGSESRMNKHGDYTDSLDRLTEILRHQIVLARALEATSVAVSIEDLERLLNIIEGDRNQ